MEDLEDIMSTCRLPTPQTFHEASPVDCAYLVDLCLEGQVTPPAPEWLRQRACELGYTLSEQRADQVCRWAAKTLGRAPQ
jgi:hypothetical protein